MTQTPAGWHPDPQVPGQQRYWDGMQWTDHVAPLAASQAFTPPTWLTSWPAIIVGFFLCLVPGFVLLWRRAGTSTGTKVAVSVGVVGLVIAGGLSSPQVDKPVSNVAAPSSSKSASPTAAAEPTQTPTPTATPTETPTPTASAAPTETATPDTASKPRLTGFAATLADWRTTHEEAPGFTPGSAYLPLISGKQAKYYGVLPQVNGDSMSDTAPPDQMIMIEYSVALPDGLDEKAAITAILSEFPSDARVTKTNSGDGSCKQFRVRSATTERQLDAHQWDGNYAFFELMSHNGAGAYSSRSVSDAILGVTAGGQFYGC